jgi:hypothetical protein
MLGILAERFRDTAGGGQQLSAMVEAAGLSMKKFNDVNTTAEQKMGMMLKIVHILGKRDGSYQAVTETLKGMTGAGQAEVNQLVARIKKTDIYAESLNSVVRAQVDSAAQAAYLAELEKSLSYQTKRLWDDFKDLTYIVGQAFVPVAKLLVGALRDIIGVFKSMSPAMQGMTIAVIGGISVWFTLQKLLATKMAGTILRTIAYIGNLTLAKMGDVAATEAVALANAKAATSEWAVNKALLANIASQIRMVGVQAWALVTKGRVLTVAELEAAALARTTALQAANTASTVTNAGAVTGLTAARKMGFFWNLKNLFLIAKDTIAKWLNVGATTASTAATSGQAAATSVATAMNIGFAASLWATLIPMGLLVLKILILVAVFAVVYIATRKLLDLFFGSSFLHLNEGISEVLPSVEGLGDTFASVFGAIGSGVEAFTGAIGAAWDKTKAFFGWLGSGIASGFMKTVGVIKDLASGLVSILVWPFELLMSSINSVTNMFSAMMQAITALAAPFMPFINLLKSAIELAWKVKESLTGSSMFHIKEGAAEVIPSMGRLEDAFKGIDRAAASVSDGTQLPDDIRIKIQEPLAAGGAAPGALAPAASAAPLGQSTGAGGGLAGGSQPGAIQVSIPVRVELDGMEMARAMVEHTIEIPNERHFNTPQAPLRGVEQ